MRTILSPALVALWLLAAPAGAATGTEPFRLDFASAADCQEQRPDVAALPGGGFVAVWQQGKEGGINSRPRVFARIFGADRMPLGPELQVNGDTDGSAPEVAANAAGNFLVVWHDGTGKLRGRVYGPSGSIQGPERSVTQSGVSGFALTATRNGGFAVVTTESDLVLLWRFGAKGEPQSPIPQVLASATYAISPHPFFAAPSVAAYGASGVVASWVVDDEETKTRTLITGTVSSPGGPFEHLVNITVPYQPIHQVRPRPVVAANAAGRILLVWNGAGSVLRAQLFAADRQPAGPAFSLSTPDAFELTAADAAATPLGDFLVAWQQFTNADGEEDGWVARVGADGQLAGPAFRAWDTFTYEAPSLAVDTGGQAVVAWQSEVLDHPAIPVCTSNGLYARSVTFARDVLRLRDGRFEVRAHWTDHAGGSGQGHAVQLTGDSGTFWFFGEDNIELIVKVLDGRAVNDHYWVFYGALSDVAFTIEVTDTVTGETRTYENPAGQLASRADTAAFPDATSAAGAAAGVVSVAPRSHVPGGGGAGPCTPSDLPVAPRPGLCLDGRFEVEVAWHAAGETGVGEGVRLTRDSGSLWFFDPANIELVVKVLDGRAVNGRFWVFYGALTDVEYTVLVRDTQTGQVRTYHNPAGQLRSRADTAAF